MERHDGRQVAELRTLTITYGIYEYALGSVLFEMGRTKILCSVTLQPSVPLFLRGQSSGWLTVEYALLPASTVTRTTREISSLHRQGRSVEISRLIGRSLRTVIDFSVLVDQTIVVDCDVLQADGGTRTASITGAYAALLMAQHRLLDDNVIKRPFLKDSVGAVSIGVLDGNVLVLDPDYHEDSESVADINVVMTYGKQLIELQGGAEKRPIEWSLISHVGSLAHAGIDRIQQFMNQNPPPRTHQEGQQKVQEGVPLFSLRNRNII